ncbi:hypothetical protein AKJ57_04335 [candidate division MSBL1 archaeon SCGC-AAA259A05]|uniref:Phosphate permease n=1 Tax=candidate division MSBL1 archaeon SCGC-AAA259A05 TaxID=1698259 RepID=A0A133U7N4_9EURY|nr:hypothetical protein AKJ57_04335 [candidate division MSBL1 archaeon SCGC-AAA259A05]
MTVNFFLVVAAAFLVSWMIGANSVSAAFAPVVGTKAGGVLRGALFAGIFGLIGAIVQGGNVAGTVGSGLIRGVELTTVTASIILLTAAALIIFGVFSHVPIPIAFTVVGGVLGAGLGLGYPLNMSNVQVIAATWIAIPFVSIFLGYAFSMALRFFLDKEDSETTLDTLVFVIGAFCAYTAGANLVGLAVGPLVHNIDLSLKILLFLGGATILLGAWIGGPRIVNAVSKDYSELGARRSACALAVATVIAQIATIMGIPVSFNEVIIASIIGSGLIVGVGGIQFKKIAKTVLSWIGSFFASMGITWIATIVFV